MKPDYLIAFILFLPFINISAQGAGEAPQTNASTIEKICLENELIEINSSVLNETRKIKIRLPEGYSSEGKYPVVYITDANYNFELAATYLHQLIKSTSIPACILVGVPHSDRGNELDVFWGEDGVKFKDFLFKELVPYVNASYATSGFNTMIGHSDGAEYNHLLMLEKGNPFRGFVSISESMNNDATERVANHFKSSTGNQAYYFIASGRYDYPERVEAGKAIADAYQVNENPNITFEHKVYSADHLNLPARSLLDGIAFVFQDYRNLAAYPKFKDYVADYKETVENRYGFVPKDNIDDIDYFFGQIMDSKDVEMYTYISDYAAEQGVFEVSTYDKAWQYYKMDAHDTSIKYWNETINDFGDTSPRIFSRNFEKAVESYLILKQPMEAIVFLEKCKKLLPNSALEFNYFIAKVAHENKVATETGTTALAYCKENFRDNLYFKKEDLAKLK